MHILTKTLRITEGYGFLAKGQPRHTQNVVLERAYRFESDRSYMWGIKGFSFEEISKNEDKTRGFTFYKIKATCIHCYMTMERTGVKDQLESLFQTACKKHRCRNKGIIR